MLFDHLLAKNWEDYSPMRLEQFSSLVYTTLDDYHDDLPERVQAFLPKMKAAKRLESYATLSGLQKALMLMTQYTSLPDHTHSAILTIENNRVFFEKTFKIFYFDLMKHTKNERVKL